MAAACSGAFRSGVAGYVCTVNLAMGIELHYRIDSTHLHAQLDCDSCSGWLALGFAVAPGSMIGANAVIGTAAGSVQKYLLAAKSVAGVQLMPPTRQTLTSTTVASVDGGLAMTFTKPLVESGAEVSISLSAANLLYAYGELSAAGVSCPV